MGLRNCTHWVIEMAGRLTSAISGGAQSARRLLIEASGCRLQRLQAV
jgi:hypothetical protein